MKDDAMPRTIGSSRDCNFAHRSVAPEQGSAGGKQRLGMLMQLVGKTVGWGTTIAILSLLRKKEVHKYAYLGEDGAFKENQNWTQLNKEGEQHLWKSEETEQKV